MQKVEGGCHCGAVRYRAEADVSQAIECNCSHCAEKGLILSFTPAAQFELIRGEDQLTEYRFNKHAIGHLFCRTCGVQPFSRGEANGASMIALNLRSLDGVDVRALQPTHLDGRSA
jgi:hypothetical protein